MAKTKKRSSKVDTYAHLLGCVKDKYIIEKTGVTMPAVSRYRKKKGIKAFKDNIKTIAAALPSISSKAADKTIAKNLDLPEHLVAVCRHLSELRKNRAAAIKKHDLLEPIVDAVLGEKIFAVKGEEEKKEAKPARKKTVRIKTTRKKTVRKKTTRKKAVAKPSPKKEKEEDSEDSS